MRMKRTPRADDGGGPREAPSHAPPAEPERVARRPVSQPHSSAEENLAYVSIVLLLTALVLACVGLDSKSWRVLPGSDSAEGIGVVKVHVAGETHYLETMGMVWPVYTASRCGLGFTIIGVLMAVWAMNGTTAFIRNNRGTIVRVLGLSVFTSTWFLWAVGLYAALFPYQPFHGDLFYLQLGANFTAWTPQTSARELHTMQRSLTPDTLVHQPWRLQQLQQRDAALPKQLGEFELSQLHLDAATRDSAAQLQRQWQLQDAQTGDIAATDPIWRRVRSKADVPSFPGSGGGSGGVPSFPSPTDTPNSGGGGGGASSNPYAAAPTPAALAQQSFYARTLYAHLSSEWTYGTGFYLVLGAALATLALPVAYTLYQIGLYLLERHRSAEVQQRWAVPVVSLFFLAWLLGLVGFASRAWKYSKHPGSGAQFGLDRFVQGGEVLRLTGVSFPDKQGRIQATSAGALALGILGVISGWFACCFAVYHVYDRAREPALVFVLATSTALLWFVALVSYGASFPHYIGVEYFELGWSFWMVLASTCVFALPLLALIGWKVVQRARQTTREERVMAVPTALALVAMGLAVAAMGTDFWVTMPGDAAGSDHLGLVRGRLGGVWMLYTQLARTSSAGVITAGVVTLVLVLSGFAVQLPAALLGLQFVSGTHDRCSKQMPLLATALSLSAALLYALAVAAYAVLMPWTDLPAGYGLSHSWRVQICAAIFTLGSAVGFGALAHPPPPGEPNILAAAIGGRTV